MLKIMGKKIFTILRRIFFLSKPMLYYLKLCPHRLDMAHISVQTVVSVSPYLYVLAVPFVADPVSEHVEHPEIYNKAPGLQIRERIGKLFS